MLELGVTDEPREDGSTTFSHKLFLSKDFKDSEFFVQSRQNKKEAAEPAVIARPVVDEAMEIDLFQ